MFCRCNEKYNLHQLALIVWHSVFPAQTVNWHIEATTGTPTVTCKQAYHRLYEFTKFTGPGDRFSKLRTNCVAVS